MVNSVNDLQIGQVYFICLIPNGKAFKSKYIGCVKEDDKPYFYFLPLERKGFKGSISCFEMDEIGVGDSKEEAKANYGRIKNDVPDVYFHSEYEIPELKKYDPARSWRL